MKPSLEEEDGDAENALKGSREHDLARHCFVFDLPLRANPKLATETVGEKLAGITIPTLVVWGGDAVVPLVLEVGPCLAREKPAVHVVAKFLRAVEDISYERKSP